MTLQPAERSRPAAEPDATEPAQFTDARIIAGVLTGHTDWYGHLVSRYQDSMHRVAWGMVRDTDVAVDLVQDAFIRAYANLARCREPESFRVWAMTMLRNRCLDHLKERRRLDVRLTDVEDPHDARSADPLELLAARTELEHALAQLPETLREAFLLRHVEDLSYDDMAVVLETTVAAVKMRVSRARDALRQQLQPAEPDVAGESGAGEDVTAPYRRSSDG